MSLEEGHGDSRQHEVTPMSWEEEEGHVDPRQPEVTLVSQKQGRE